MSIVMMVVSGLIGVLNSVMIFTFLNKKSVLFINSTRGMFFLAVFVALVMCSFGIQISLKAESFKGIVLTFLVLVIELRLFNVKSLSLKLI